MRIRAAWIGKSKHPAACAWTEEYLTRLQGFARRATVAGEELAGRDPQAKLLERAQGARLWLCDPGGRTFTSPEFAKFLEREAAAAGNREIVIAVGGADGFSAPIQAAAAGKLSLGALTLSHELARVVLLEQLYRALAILSGHPYPH